MKRIQTLILVLFLIFSISCKENRSKQTEKVKEQIQNQALVKINIIRIEQELWKDKSPKGIENVLKKYPYFNKKYLLKTFPDDKISVKEVGMGINNPAVDTLYKISQDVFGDMKDLQTQFAQAATIIKQNYPDYYPQDIYTFISGMGFWGQDFLISDSIIVISLDFFLAENCKYQPQQPQYILKRYKKEYVIPTAIASIATHFIQSDITDNSLVAEMIFFGKMYYFLQITMPDLSDEIICGYDSEDLKEINNHQDVIWAHLIDKKLLFETKHEITNKYIGERPNVQEIGNKCPGRIGRWLGWQIVQKYMELNPKITLKELMAEKDAKKIFIASKYKPETK